jgi:hypothetical protein
LAVGRVRGLALERVPVQEPAVLARRPPRVGSKLESMPFNTLLSDMGLALRLQVRVRLVPV